MPKSKYTDEQVKEAVAASFTMAAVMRYLGMRPAGGSQAHLTNRVKSMGLDTSHFTGQAWNAGKHLRTRKTAEEILSVMPEGSKRIERRLLLRALDEKGVIYKCAGCGISEWLGKPITLDIDHIDGNWLNNTFENLRFMCPNCHSQTDTFGFKKRQ